MKNCEIKFKKIFNKGPYFRLQELSDGRIFTYDECSFNIHKVILARCSDFFRGLFCGIEKGKTEYRISDISGDCLSDILCYIYTEEICVNESNMTDLLLTSDYLLLKDLHLKIKQYVKSKISDTNCFNLISAAHHLNENDLFQKCFKFIQGRFEKIFESQRDDIVDLPQELLKNILSNRNLNVQNEQTVWQAIVHWTKASITSRINCVPSLLSALAVNEIGENLFKEIMNNEIVLNNIYMKYLRSIDSLNISAYKSEVLFNFLLDTSDDFYPQGFRIPKNLNIISRYTRELHTYEEGNCDIYVSYDESLDLWRKITSINFEPEYVIALGCNIYLFEKIRTRFVSFSLKTMEWKSLADMRSYGHTVFVIENSFYVLYKSNRGIYKLDVYNEEQNRWFNKATLRNIYYAAAAVVGRNIYVVGMTQNSDGMIGQMLNPIDQVSAPFSSPRIFRYTFELVVYHEKIYSIGGFNADEFVMNAEMYDPSVDLWKVLPNLPFSCSWVATIILNDQLIIYDFSSMLSSIDSDMRAALWNETKECWKIIKNPSFPEGWPKNLHHYRFSTLDDIKAIKILTKENRGINMQMNKCPFSFL